MIPKKLALYWSLASLLAAAPGVAPERAVAREELAATLFRVEIAGTERDLLERVRAVEPKAFVKPAENIIQAGLFGDRAKAKRLAKALKRSGVRAEIVKLEDPVPAPVAAARLFRVEVAGSERELLARVRAIEPGAFVRPGGNSIQAGLFGEVDRASQTVANLELLGVTAQIVAVDRTDRLAAGDGTVAPGTELTFVPLETPTVAQPIEVPLVPPAPLETAIAPQNFPAGTQSGAFYVVVPGRQRRLAQLETEVRRGLNAPELPVQLRNAPFGPHVSVGPFARLEDAQRWTIQLRLRGLDGARVEQL